MEPEQKHIENKEKCNKNGISTTSSTPTDILTGNIPKPKTDKREYHYKELKNGLKCLLISDMETDKSSAALCINIGSLCEPDEYPGLAHFCEHMLFMGTEKFPVEDEFTEFLNMNSGETNAYTGNDCTNYHFEVGNHSFDEALDMFAQFFVKPLFNKNSVNKEMKAVDSEYKKSFQDDDDRYDEIINAGCNPKSRFSRFSMGSLETLNKKKIRPALLEFYNNFYSSHLMSLVVLSNQSLDDLNKLTESLFSEVKRLDNVKIPNLKEYPPFTVDNLGYLYKIVPISEHHELSLFWVLESYKNSYKDDYLGFITSVFGYTAEDSLANSLLKDNLISWIDTDYYEFGHDSYTGVNINFRLTDQGLKEWEQILKRVFYFLRKYQMNDFSKEYFDEQKNLDQLFYDYKNKEDPYDYVADLAEDLTIYEKDDLLAGSNNYKQFKGEGLRAYFNKLTITNMNLYLSSKTFNETCNLLEPWYKSKYSKEDYKSKIEEIWKSIDEVNNINSNTINTINNICLSNQLQFDYKFLYPSKNVFTPYEKDLILKPITNKHEFPIKLSENNRNSVWFKQDYTFLHPKIIMMFQIYHTESIFYNTKELVLSSIWKSVVDHSLREFIYISSEAGISVELSSTDQGMYIQISGFSSHFKQVLIEFLKKWKQIKYEDTLTEFNKFKEQLSKKYKNFSTWKACDVVENLLITFNIVPNSSYPELQLVLENDISFQDFLKFSNELSGMKSERTNYIEILAQGNITEEEVTQICKESLEIIQKDNKDPIDKSNFYSYNHIKLPEKTNHYYTLQSDDKTSDNSAILSYFQIGHLDDKDICLLDFLTNILSEDFFDELRTNQQLGYIVSLDTTISKQVTGLTFLVQSSEKSPEYIYKKINEFIFDSVKEIEEMDEETFERYKESVLDDLKVKDLIFYDEAFRNIEEIRNKTYIFDRTKNQIKIVEGITKKEVLDFYNHHIIKNFRRFDIEMVSYKHIEENKKLEGSNFNSWKSKTGCMRKKVKSINEYKRILPLYQDFDFENINK